MRNARLRYLVLVSFPLVLLGCAGGARQAFQSASDAGTIEAYQQFASLYPDDPLAKEAGERIIAIEFENAQREATVEAYGAFVSRHPSSPWTEKAITAMFDLELEDIKSHGPGNRFVLPFNVGDGFRTEATFENGAMSGGDFQWGAGATGHMIAGDGSTFVFAGTNSFPETAGPFQMGSMKAYLPGGLVGTVFTASASSPLVFVLVRPHGLVHLYGRGTVTLSNGESVDVTYQRNAGHE